jgi:uncharacterized protein YcbK (DUF882 family)
LAAPSVLRGAASAESLKAEFRALSLHNLHTGERLTAVYWEKGQYIPEALTRIDTLLRDHRNGEVRAMAPRLLDTLAELAGRLETNKPFEVISGYRSPATNALLRSQGHAVAERSLHMDGIAADIRVQGRSLSLMRKTAVAMRAGGVGYYPKDGFIHVDIGRVRTW